MIASLLHSSKMTRTGRLDRHAANARLTKIRNLERTLEKYTQTTHLDWDIHSCTWKDVFAEMDKAGVAYEKRARGIRNLPRQGMRRLGKNASDISAWLDFIPSDYGLGILTSGLKIVFTVRTPDSLVKTDLVHSYHLWPDREDSFRKSTKGFASVWRYPVHHHRYRIAAEPIHILPPVRVIRCWPLHNRCESHSEIYWEVDWGKQGLSVEERAFISQKAHSSFFDHRGGWRHLRWFEWQNRSLPKPYSARQGWDAAAEHQEYTISGEQNYRGQNIVTTAKVGVDHMRIGVDGLRHTANNTHHLAEGINSQVDEVKKGLYNLWLAHQEGLKAQNALYQNLLEWANGE